MVYIIIILNSLIHRVTSELNCPTNNIIKIIIKKGIRTHQIIIKRRLSFTVHFNFQFGVKMQGKINRLKKGMNHQD